MELESEDLLADFHKRRMQSLEHMFVNGIAIATSAAMEYCAKHDLTVPPWLKVATAKHLVDLLMKGASKQRGRSSNIVDRYRQDMNDYARWDEVTTVREKQKEILQEVEFLRAHADSLKPGLLEEREKTLAWAGRSLERAYQCASMLLRGTTAFGGPDAMKASYLKVTKACRNPTYRYHMLDDDFLISIGIQPISRQFLQVRKHVPLYDLTL